MNDCLFVAPNGNDAWCGTLPDPAANGKDGPLATVTRARDVLRERREKDGLRQVLIRWGTYFLSEPLVFEPRDSGTESAPVIYRAYPGETPILSGGERITGWRECTVHGQRCWMAELPDVKAGKWTFTQLFVNGERRWRPRLPKTGFFHFADRVPADFLGGLVRYGNGPTHAYYRPGDLQPFHNITDVKLLTYNAWYETHHRLKSVDEHERRVDFQSRGFSGGYTGDGSRYIVDNVFEALDTPGEWYLDRPTGLLYYLPLPGEDPETTEVIAPRLAELVRFAGTDGASVQHIQFENLAFHHAEWDYALDFAGSLQAADLVPGAIVFDKAEHCALYGCHIAHIAPYAVDIRPGSPANSIVGCVLEDLGAGGVRVGNEELPGSPGVYAATVKSDDRPLAATIADCVIRDGGKLFPSAVGVWIGNAGRNRVFHNHIYDLSYTGISCGWIWGYAPSRTVGNRIEGNHVHHIAWDRLLHDLGGIYALGRQPGGRIRGNYMHHVGGNGIYLDEGSSEFIVEGNLVHDVDCVGFTLHYGRDNEVRHNVFACCRLTAAAMEPHRSMVFHHNVVVWDGGAMSTNPWGANTQWWPEYNLCHDLLLWNSTGGEIVVDGDVFLKDWQRLGQFANTIVTDPLFIDPANGEFSFRSDSPAPALGIKPLSIKEVGPRFEQTRPASFAEWRAAFPIPPEPMASSLLSIPEPGLLRLTIGNLGEAPISGHGSLIVSPSDALMLEGEPMVRLHDLAPGVEFVAEWRYTVSPAAPRRVRIEAALNGGGLLATMLHLNAQPEDLRLTNVGPLATPEAIESALAGVPPLPLKHPLYGIVAGEVRLTAAGDHLAFDMRVVDTDIRLGELAWQGSCVEIFAAPLGVAGVNPTQPAPGISQLFLVPAAGTIPARALHHDGGEKPSPDIRLCCRSEVDGYRLFALIPFERLGVADREQFTFQVVVTATPKNYAKPMRFPLFHYDSGAFANARQHGLVKMER